MNKFKIFTIFNFHWRGERTVALGSVVSIHFHDFIILKKFLGWYKNRADNKETGLSKLFDTL